jgi:excisionase family DNA binding protein
MPPAVDGRPGERRTRRQRRPLPDAVARYRLVTAEEAAELLGVELSTVRQWTYQRRLPVIHPGGGRAARYRLSALLDLMDAWERPALASRPGEPLASIKRNRYK